MGAGFLFVLAIFMAGGVMFMRRRRFSSARNTISAQPGRNPEHAVPVTRFDDMDRFILSNRCFCGGRLETISEGSLQSAAGSLRVVHTECWQCEEPHDFFFETSKIAH